ncbi:MAG: hypothetical protein IID44_11370 [Planctomycetes bacterium]|nr:hypothetical protein [Planctomycetota bacterium]
MLRCAIQLDHGQMPPLLVEADDDLKPLARSPGNERLGLGAGRTTWPTLARFDPWSAMGALGQSKDVEDAGFDVFLPTLGEWDLWRFLLAGHFIIQGIDAL